MTGCYESEVRGSNCTERSITIVLSEIVVMERSCDPGVWYWTVHLKSGGRVCLLDVQGYECRAAWDEWRKAQP